MLLPKLQLLRCAIFAIRGPDPAAAASSPSGSRNHRTALYCRQAFLVAAVRKSASEVPLRFIDVLRYAPDIVRSQPRTVSLLSGNSVLRAVFGSGRPTPPRQLSVFQRFCSVLARGEPPAMLPGARVRRKAADNKPASTCCGLQISVNLQICQCAPQRSFPVSD